MSAHEFITPIMEVIDTKGFQPVDWITLYEQQISGTTLFETLDQNAIDYLDGLQYYSDAPVIGNRYVPAFLMLFSAPHNKISYLGDTKMLTLLDDSRIEDGLHVYDFYDEEEKQKKTWPFDKMTALSYSKLYLFSNKDSYDLFRSALQMKFSVLPPEADFT